MAGERIGIEVTGPGGEPFKLADYLGHGAFGDVYRGIGKSSGVVVAVKLLPINELDNPDSRIALLNEIILAQKINHPNVVSVLHVNDNTSSSTGPYLVMEYVAGGTLASFLRAQSAAKTLVPLARAREMMIDIAQGARAINGKLIHRDIKPDNVLLDGARLKISDFGISKVVDERTRTHTFKGGQHVRYMAPEGWEGETNSFKLDVYSVGLVFYEILTLGHPLTTSVTDATDWRAWRKAHLFATCPDVRSVRSEVSLAMSQLLSRMVSKRPQDRPNWDEVIAKLSSDEQPDAEAVSVSAAIEAAVKRQQVIDRVKLAQAEDAEREAHKEELYRHACAGLVKSFDGIMEHFNRGYQLGKIATSIYHIDGRRYSIPTGGAIKCAFFSRCRRDFPLGTGQLVGGGFLGIENGVSANLLLLREAKDDLYGKWLGCLVNLSYVAHPSDLIGRWGITERSVFPMGFGSEPEFYEEIKYALGGPLHIFKYEIRGDVKKLFTDMLETAFAPPE